MLSKLSYLNSNIALTLGYLNPALNNSAKKHILVDLCNREIKHHVYHVTKFPHNLSFTVHYFYT